MGLGRSFFGRGKAGEIGLCRSSLRTHRCIQGTHRLVQLNTRLLILLVEVVPAPESTCQKNYQNDAAQDEFRLVFHGPVNGGLSGADCGPTEPVLLELMTGFCAHEIPFWILLIPRLLGDSHESNGKHWQRQRPGGLTGSSLSATYVRK